jgi:hypothetical protein
MENNLGKRNFSRQERDAELKRLLDSCPDEVLMLLLELVRARDREAHPRAPSAALNTATTSPTEPGVDHF